jgi:hypothetical protein
MSNRTSEQNQVRAARLAAYIERRASGPTAQLRLMDVDETLLFARYAHSSQIAPMLHRLYRLHGLRFKTATTPQGVLVRRLANPAPIDGLI